MTICCKVTYNSIEVVPLITSLISNPNTPFNKTELIFSSVLFYADLFFILCRCPVIIGFMKHLTKTCNETLYSSALFDFYFKGLKTGILDIETTGLNPSKNKFILGGLYDCDSNTMHQCFAENRNEESSALICLLHELSKLDMVITYNGKHFDLPFIEKRRQVLSNALSYVSYDNIQNASSKDSLLIRKTAAFQLPYNLDLYLVLNGHSPLKRFVPNLKQKTVENYMGLWQSRSDEISGAESVELYNEYEKTGDNSLREKILLHNNDDVLQLTRLVKVISKSDFHKAMFHLGFPVGNLIVEKIKLERNILFVSGKQQKHAIDYMEFSFDEYPVETRFDSRTSSFTIKFPIIRDSGMAIIDLEAAHVNTKEFSIYPGYGSGFLIIENHSEKKHMEINHFIKSFIHIFLNQQ